MRDPFIAYHGEPCGMKFIGRCRRAGLLPYIVQARLSAQRSDLAQRGMMHLVLCCTVLFNIDRCVPWRVMPGLHPAMP